MFPPYRCYSHAVEVSAGSRLLFVSGLNGFLADGEAVPESFEEQGELVWGHLGAILRSANMDFENLVSLRIDLPRPEYDAANMSLRLRHLGSHRPALAVVCCQLLDPRWKLEIEAVAAH